MEHSPLVEVIVLGKALAKVTRVGQSSLALFLIRSPYGHIWPFGWSLQQPSLRNAWHVSHDS